MAQKLSSTGAICGLLLVCGCATSTGIVPMGQDTFMISKQGATGFTSTGSLKADALREAGDFCIKTQKNLQIVSTQETPAGFGRFPQAEVQFMCLSQGDPELARPKLSPGPNTVIEVRKR